MAIRTNDNGLVYLNSRTMTAIFDCVYGINDHLEPETKKLLQEDMFHSFIKMLLAQQDFNYRYRFSQTAYLFPLFEATVGPMETNSDGTTLWLAMGLAIKELYGLRRETLKGLLEKIKLRK
ncbi:hypothetical protein [Evansella tamaricis]|uniref:Uncharacterized protein n=1 Tax=Evansella tamaricis TaxID=2069301 RepID=A0ABS6JGJ1_9BACI|nr:hypothetical protein [Evansella tamaricis]MBU9711575.1 hypothetical protein [Evansella tamaricis]